MPADYLPESSQLDPFDLKDMLVLNYNPSTETYETEYKTQTLLVNVGPDRVYYADSYVTPRLLVFSTQQTILILPSHLLDNRAIGLTAEDDAVTRELAEPASVRTVAD